ncbi:MAG: chromate efflux transporter [Hyphomonadaceae bacterium]|nr:chromate efflux transporter [Hyphomonadaceae bacterium]
MTQTLAKPAFSELVAASFKVGCLGFGGPAGQISLMHRIFVDEKKWLDEARYLHALNYCMLLPGPEAQQLATYVGWLLHGVRGGIVAGLLFVLPGAVIVFGLSWLYVLHAQTPVVDGLFFGVKAAVLALVAEAMWKIGKRSLKTGLDLAIAVAAFASLFLFGVPFPVVIIAAAALGMVRIKPANSQPLQPEATPVQPRATGALGAAALWGIVWLAPLAAVLIVLGPDHILTQVGLLFSQLAVVTFGGAYAVLAYLQQQAVDAHGWLAAGQMIDGLGLAETTPGPLILVNQFVGFLAGWQAPGGGFLLAAAAAAMASWCTFAPSFLWIFAGAPFAERLRTSPVASAALASVTTAVLGVIANLALWFGLHVLFARTLTYATPWGHALVAPDPASFDIVAAIFALAAGVALFRFKTNVVVVVIVAALAGVAWRLLL